MIGTCKKMVYIYIYIIISITISIILMNDICNNIDNNDECVLSVLGSKYWSLEDETRLILVIEKISIICKW
jgi:hypothetical protein